MTAFKLTKILTFNGLFAARTLFTYLYDGNSRMCPIPTRPPVSKLDRPPRGPQKPLWVTKPDARCMKLKYTTSAIMRGGFY